MEERLAEVHSFWFGENSSEAVVVREKGKLWFAKDASVDRQIEDRFGDLVRLASNDLLDSRSLPPKLRLAHLLLLDQFTRNIYRNDPRSFAADHLARKLSGELLRQGVDELGTLERVFLYLPYEHSEDLDDQKKSVALFLKLLESSDASLLDSCKGFYAYAVRHHDIIVRFGRFPHRNAILGRETTPAEAEFLLQPGSSF